MLELLEAGLGDWSEVILEEEGDDGGDTPLDVGLTGVLGGKVSFWSCFGLELLVLELLDLVEDGFDSLATFAVEDEPVPLVSVCEVL